MICSLILIPQLQDDDLMREDIKFKNYLIDQGWNGTFGYEDDELDAGSDTSDNEIEKQAYVETIAPKT